VSTAVFQCHVFDDQDADQTQDALEADLMGVTVEAYDGLLLVDSNATNASGNADLNVSWPGMLPHTFRITQVLLPGNERTSLDPFEIEVFDLDVAIVLMSQRASAKTCTRPTSTWVWKFCWDPTIPAVTVTFHKKGKLTVTVAYPGTTLADYQKLKAGASKGKHIWDFFYHRPYSLLPLDP
jgi:hypothetical protein